MSLTWVSSRSRFGILSLENRIVDVLEDLGRAEILALVVQHLGQRFRGRQRVGGPAAGHRVAEFPLRPLEQPAVAQIPAR